MSKLDEIIGRLKQQEENFERWVVYNTQEVMGKSRPVCTNCGFCPSAMREELELARDTPELSEPSLGTTPDVPKPINKEEVV